MTVSSTKPFRGGASCARADAASPTRRLAPARRRNAAIFELPIVPFYRVDIRNSLTLPACVPLLYLLPVCIFVGLERGRCRAGNILAKRRRRAPVATACAARVPGLAAH